MRARTWTSNIDRERDHSRPVALHWHARPHSLAVYYQYASLASLSFAIRVSAVYPSLSRMRSALARSVSPPLRFSISFVLSVVHLARDHTSSCASTCNYNYEQNAHSRSGHSKHANALTFDQLRMQAAEAALASIATFNSAAVTPIAIGGCMRRLRALVVVFERRSDECIARNVLRRSQ